jgi:hypothetical protein
MYLNYKLSVRRRIPCNERPEKSLDRSEKPGFPCFIGFKSFMKAWKNQDFARFQEKLRIFNPGFPGNPVII